MLLLLYIVMWLSYIAVIIVNVLSEMLPINGQTIAEIPNRIEVLVTPAGYVFAIWIVIYAAVGLWLIFQLKKVKSKKMNRTISVFFIASCLCNIGWLISWHYELFIVSISMMILLLISLIVIYLQYKNNETGLSERFPFSLYVAWISVATIVNVSYVLKYYGISLGVSEIFGSLILVTVAIIIAYIASTYSKDYYFVLVVLWALIGIIVKNENTTMQVGTATLAGFLFVAAIGNYLSTKSSNK